MQNAINPWLGVLQGQEVESGLRRAQMEGEKEREDEAMRAAYGELGQQPNFTGFEGVPGAIKPEFLKTLYQKNPQAAVQMEGQLAQPFAFERDIQKAGRIEQAKKEGDAKVWNAMAEKFFPTGGPTATDTPMANEPAPPAGIVPASSNAFATAMAPPQPHSSTRNFGGLSDTERSFELGPTGPKFSVKASSPFDRALKEEEAGVKRGGLKVQEENLTREQSKDREHALGQKSQAIREIAFKIAEVREKINRRDLTPPEGRQQIAQLEAMKGELQGEREAILRGKAPAPMAASTQGEQPEAPTIMPTNRPTTKASKPIVEPPYSEELPPGLNEREAAQTRVKGREEQVTAANKEIAAAREHALKIGQYMPQIQQLVDLVTKQDLGAPVISSLPGGLGTSALMLDKSNAKLKNLNDALTNMFATPGQSQLMNTIIERQMQSASLPGLGVEAQQNKLNAAGLKSNVEALKQFPTFLEKWAKTHGGTLDGATEAWLDYTQHNPSVRASTDKRGKVQLLENKAVMTPDKWLALRAQGKVKTLKDGTVLIQEGR